MLKSIKSNLQLVVNQYKTYNLLFILVAFALVSSCSTLKNNRDKKIIADVLKTQRKTNFHSGILVVDQKSTDTLINYNSSKNFIPASTLKLLTFFTAKNYLEKYIPAMFYEVIGDTLFIKGTGDPSFLNPNLKDSTALKFLSKFPVVSIDMSNYEGNRYMPGWAWEDYSYYFSPELTSFPIHRNVVQFSSKDSLEVSPAYFNKNVRRTENKSKREENQNIFHINSNLLDTLQIPFKTSSTLTVDLLSNLTKQSVVETTTSTPLSNVLYGKETDSIYKQMLWESDNFTAEQMLLVSSSTLSDTLSFNNIKSKILDEHFKEEQKQLRWVDGSGLSRYNLASPKFFITLLNKLYNQVPENELFHLLPTWNANGTVLKPEPNTNYFIFAKSGSMGNVYNLCGYLKTKKGSVLLFSFMNTNFNGSSAEIRATLHKTLVALHNAY
ncbi:peptidase M15 [Croceivirga lutea]|uniref:D-alanyl-D-alanine carboxypeptidase n=1 Tax=Croceivirga lutea TaxID=1775167 RepID=UPI00163B55C0|nr:D-alanyl-D-alanine carboxypeptidase [Croceivirga lutea]GGG48126.1 peptidase M15 [Croceivirga lutea]